MKLESHGRETRLQVAVAAVLVVGALLLAALANGCAQSSRKETDFSQRQITAHQLGGRALQKNRLVRQFLTEQAAQGRNVGLRRVRVAVLGGVTIVWEDGVAIDRVGIVGDGAGGGIGVTQHEEGSSAVTSSPPRGVSMMWLGPRKSGLRNVKGATETATACTMVAAYGNRATSCFEKWRIRDTVKIYDYYVYDRWGTATPGNGNGATEVTIRSRQRRGTEGSIASLLDYWPSGGDDVCNPANGSGSTQLGPGGGVADFSATFPIASCAATDIDVDARTFSMMSQWKGHGARAGARATRSSQFYVTVRTWQGKAPQMADYIWASFGRSSVWRKSGWPKS